MLCQTTKPVQSFILVDSDKIQERAKEALEIIADYEKRCDSEYLLREMGRRNWWRKLTFRRPLSLDEVKDIVDEEVADDNERPLIWSRHYPRYPKNCATQREVAERLLAMSKVERRVAVSSHDFAWFFR